MPEITWMLLVNSKNPAKARVLDSSQGGTTARPGQVVEVMRVDEHNAVMARGAEVTFRTAQEHHRLREAAQAVFDAAGNGDDALADSLVALGLVLAGDPDNRNEED